MKERPILFSGEMVRALLAGTKTQTRRIVKPQPPCECDYVINGANSHALCRSIKLDVWCPPTAKSVDHRLPCPYGMPGDRLWVKETFYHLDDFHGQDCTWYRADHDTFPGSWKPSIFMRRGYSRLTLDITAVRVEPLHAITEEDARAEGVEPWFGDIGAVSARDRYAELWETINGLHTWRLNPWVWVIEFRNETDQPRAGTEK